MLSAPLVIKGARAAVRLACGDRVTIRAPAGLLQEIFDLCDGRTPLRGLERKLAEKWNRAASSALLRRLVQLGILADSSEVALQSWKYVENPRTLEHEPSASEIRSLPLRAARRTAARRGFKYWPVPRSRLGSLLARRKSTREFSGQPIPFRALLRILWAAYGVVPVRSGDHGVPSPRTVPSAGAICPLRFTLVNLRPTAELGEGAYSVHFKNDGAIGFQRQPISHRHIFRTFADPGSLRQASGLILVSGDLKLTARKYGNRALLYVPIEAGHAAQNALLAAAELGVAAVEIGGFIEDELRKLIGDGRRLFPLTTVVLGGKKNSRQRSPTRSPAASFHWIEVEDSQPPLPFYLGMVQPAGRPRDEDYCWGRARDPLHAFDKATAEAVERDACANPVGIYRAALSELKNALDPRQVVSYHPLQYSRPRFPFAPFRETTRCWWTDGRDHFSGNRIAVLADLVYFQRRARTKLKSSRTTASTSSGVAAFTDRDKALERAVLELCERDGFMRAWLAKAPLPGISRKGLPRPIVARLAELERLGLRVAVKELPGDLLPVILVFAQHSGKTFTVVGADADYDPESALDHALMEVEAIVHMRLRQDRPRRIRPDQVASAWDHAELYAQRAYFRRADFLAEGPTVPRLRRKRAGQARTWKELQSSLQRLARRLIAVDITPPDATLVQGDRLFVVRAIVPGLMPINFGYGTEALGTALSCVPSLKEKRMNRAPLFPHPFA